MRFSASLKTSRAERDRVVGLQVGVAGEERGAARLIVCVRV